MSGYTVARDIRYTDSRDTRSSYDLYMPEGNSVVPLIIYFYGGSLKNGKKDENKFAKAAAEAGLAVAVPDYRLMPDAAYPDFINDAADAVDAILRSLPERVGRVYVGGHSAGAYLSMMLSFDRSYLDARRTDRSLISGWLFISGQPTKHFSILEAEGLDPRAVIIDETSALYHVNSSDGEPLLIVTSDCDMPGRREQNELLYAALRNFDYRSRIHFAELSECSHGALVKPDKDGQVPVMPYVLQFIEETSNGKDP